MLLVAVASIAGTALWRRRLVVTLLCIGLIAGGALSGLEWSCVRQQRAIAADSGARAWNGVVEADPTLGEYGGIVRVHLQGGPLAGARVRVCWPEGEPLPDLGRLVGFSAILKPLPLEEPWARRMQRGGLCASGTAWRADVGAWRPGMVGRLYAWRATTLKALHLLQGPGADLAEGIVLGDRRRLLGTPAEQDFQVLGLTHLVAVSGSHLALACGAVGFIGMLLRVPKRVLVQTTVMAGAAYAIVTGLPFSALRSLLMLLVVGAGQLLGRRGGGLAALAVAVIAVLALEPWAVFDLGLQLSVLAVMGLLLFGSLAASWVRAGLPAWLTLLAEPLGLTLVAQLTTVPVVASAFGMVSVLAPIANALAGACVSVALLLGLSGCVLLSAVPEIGMVLLRLCCTVLGLTAGGAHLMARVPGAAVAINGGFALMGLTVGGLVLLWARWPLPQGRSSGMRLVAAVVAASLALALGPAPPHRCAITVLDVGQGDAILVQDGGRTMLVDAAPDQLSIRKALARTGVRRVDVLVLTHAHDDHTGGVDALPAIAEIGWVGVSGAGDSSQPAVGGVAPRPLHAGDRWRIGDTVVTVLWPAVDEKGELETNDTSVVLEVRRGEFEMVLTGDAETAAQQGMLRNERLHEIDVLKVPHHGSSNGLTADALAVWSPDLAVISVGEGNDFGHPAPSTMSMLQAATVQIVRTDHVGDVTLAVGDRGYRVRHGRSSVVRARMNTYAAGMCTGRTLSHGAVEGPRGSEGTISRRAKARLPHLRRRGVAGRTRAPPPARPCRRGS